jgi:hypothetical protein
MFALAFKHPPRQTKFAPCSSPQWHEALSLLHAGGRISLSRSNSVLGLVHLRQRFAYRSHSCPPTGSVTATIVVIQPGASPIHARMRVGGSQGGEICSLHHGLVDRFLRLRALRTSSLVDLIVSLTLAISRVAAHRPRAEDEVGARFAKRP